MWVSNMFSELQPWGFFSHLMPFLHLKLYFFQVDCIQQAATGATASVAGRIAQGDGSAKDAQSSLPASHALTPVDSPLSRSESRPLSGSYTVSSTGGSQSADFPARSSAPLVTVEYLRETTESALPGVFTATLKVMIDVDSQPALESVSLDQAAINLLSCFAKCYGKGDAQNRRGIIRFAASKVTTFRSFVTLRFSVATRSLSSISKPLALCNDPNFWYAFTLPVTALTLAQLTFITLSYTGFQGRYEP